MRAEEIRVRTYYMNILYFLGFLVFLFLAPGAIAYQDLPANTQEVTPAPQDGQATVSAIIKYDLAFPGILPDHPLYKLKVLRDKISATLINNPRKKIEFYLLQTDKGILASAILVDKGKIDLAAQTALKAEHNYTLITNELYRLPTRPEVEFFKKLNASSLKHQEVLLSLVKRIPKDKQKTFLNVIDFSKRNWQSVVKYKELEEEAAAEEAEERVKQEKKQD